MRSAAAIGELFGLDPVMVLDEPDPLKRSVRYAATNYIQNERRKAQQKK